MKESTISNNARRELIRIYGKKIKIYKISDRFTKGIPDFLICFNGKFIAIETKTPGESARPNQDYELQSIRDAGGSAQCLFSVKEIVDFIKKHDNIQAIK